MFVEPSHSAEHAGWIEVICGSMFSGKTEELIRRLNRVVIAQQTVEIFKPAIDNRYATHDVVSHNANAIKSTPVAHASEILAHAKDCKVVGIDEAQFFDEALVDVANELANEGKRVIIAGLDMDYKGRPFKPMDGLMAIAEYITKVRAICMDCGNIATYTHRRTKSVETVVVGEKDIYQALCRNCFYEKTHG
jgi:thymidine kinase